MKFVALGAWLLATFGGLYLMGVWLAHGGLSRQPTKVTRYPVTVVVAHPLLAFAGLIAWIRYMTMGGVGYAWSAFCALLVVALLGFVMLTRWLVGRGGRHARGGEQAFPFAAVIVHGAVGMATFVSVFLTVVAISRP